MPRGGAPGTSMRFPAGTDLAVAGVAIGLAVLAWWPTGRWLHERWTAADSFYGHGFLVAPLTLWLAFRKRSLLASIPAAPSSWGLALVIPALLVHLAALRIEVYSPSGLALIPLVFGVIWFLSGFRRARALWFPVLFLVFAIPLPLPWVSEAAFHLKMFAVSAATGLLDLFGMRLTMEGSYIYFEGGGRLVVGSPCSGLRSLLSILAVGVLYTAEFAELSKPGRVVLTGPARARGRGVQHSPHRLPLRVRASEGRRRGDRHGYMTSRDTPSTPWP